MLLYTGIGRSIVYILDTDDLVAENIVASELIEKLEKGVLTIGNKEALLLRMTDNGVPLLPHGFYTVLGFGDIWFVFKDILYVWNNFTGCAFKMSLAGSAFIEVYTNGYRVKSVLNEGRYLVCSGTQLVSSNVDGDAGITIDSESFRRRCLLGTVGDLWKEC